MKMAPGDAAADRRTHDALRDQLVEHLPPLVRISAHGWRPWASASFAGARHWFDLTPLGPESAMQIEQWQTVEWGLADRFVADIAVQVGEPAIGEWRLEILTVDD